MTQTRFPDNIDVWLKDLASYLNVKLEEVPETTDPVFSGKAKGMQFIYIYSGENYHKKYG